MSREPENKNYRSLLEDAFVELKRMRSEIEAVERASAEPIAIIGMGCRFPGAQNLAAFWRLLCQSEDAITEVPASRWNANKFFDANPKAAGKINSRWGGFLEDLDLFDAAFFGISPREALHVDPRQRLIMEVAWEALEDAGIPADTLAGSDTGVYIATLNNDYDFLLTQDYDVYDSFTGAGTANTIIANRLSYFLDLRGPSLVLDTACSGSLVAIELACRSLRSGETGLALAGGVNVNLLPKGEVFFSSAGALSPDGRCHTFDSGANGIVRSEGAGIVVLKSLTRALADEDRIYALIKGGAINHDGRSNGIMAPNGLAQQAVLAQAYRKAGISPALVQYIEAHGTGTPLGDSIEVKALEAVLSKGRPPERPCVIGSVKTNIGHTESAAGVAGVIKLALSIKRRLIPANLHLKELNPLIADTPLPLKIFSEPGPWPVESEPLIAGVSSFGFGGTNAHLVMQEAPQPASHQKEAEPVAQALTVSAHSSESLKEMASAYARFLKDSGEEITVRDVCYTASVRRCHHDHRLAVVARDKSEMIDLLEVFVTGEDIPAAFPSGRAASRAEPGKVAFVFSGQGTHWLGMGRELIASEPVFGEVIQKCERLFKDYADWSLIEELNAEDRKSRLNESDVAQPAIFAVQVALAALWRSWGITPDAVIGQSLGEIAAAHVCGALSLEDAARVVFHRSRLMKKIAGKGKTAVVGLTAQQAQLALAGFEEKLSVAGSAAPTSCVISGDPAALDQVLNALKSREIFCRLLENVDVAFHSPQMDAIKKEMVEAISEINPVASDVPFISTITATFLEGESLDANYWGKNLREPFRFADAVGQMIEQGYDCFVEISPHTALAGAIRQSLIHLNREGIALGSLTKEKPERASMLSALAGLYMRGHTVDWKALHAACGVCVSLPTYAWQKERYWYDQLLGSKSSTRSETSGEHRAGEHLLLGERLTAALASGHRCWEARFDAKSIHYLKDHSIEGAVVFPGAAYIEMAFAAARQAFEANAPSVEEVKFERAMILPKDEAVRAQLILSPAANDEADFHIYSRPADAQNRSGSWTLNASGKIHLSARDKAPSAAKAVSVEQRKARCPQQVTSAEHYKELELRGLRYGPSFQTVKRIFRREAEALSLIEMPEALQPEASLYTIHPSMLDAGFQTVAATLPSAETSVYLPRSVKSLRVYDRPGDRVWCHARLDSNKQAETGELEANIELMNDEGRALVEIEGLRLQRLDASGYSERIEDCLYELQWVAEARSSVAPIQPADSCWLIFADSKGTGRQLASSLESLSYRCALVYPAQEYRAEPDNRVYWLDPSDPQQFQRLLNDVFPADGPACRAIVHLWALDAALDEQATRSDLQAAQLIGCEALLRILQSIASTSTPTSASAGRLDAARLWVVTQGAQAVGPQSAPLAVAQSSLWGMGRVIALEHAEFWGGLIDLDPDGQQRQAQPLLEELLHPAQEKEVAYRNGRRYVARLKRSRQLAKSAEPYKFKADGSYLITGGLSGLGLETARWMAKRGARRLILLGRTALPDRCRWRELDKESQQAKRASAVMELERMGVSVRVESLNVADENALSEFFKRHRDEGWPPIKGVAHSAGAINDRLVMRMDLESFREILEPKLYGSWSLHRAVKGEELDFFVMFSSVTSIMGKMGQANYAAGNAFMDGLAHYRKARGLPALNINWGPWAEIGLYARQQQANQTAPPGIKEINREEGLAIFSALLESEATQAIVLKADWAQMKSSPLTIEISQEQKRAESKQADGALAMEILLADEQQRRKMIEGYLKQEVGMVLRCDEDRLNVSKALTSMGMDSIMAVELKNRIQADLSISVPMVDLFTGSIAHLVERLQHQLQHDARLAEALAEIEQLSMDEVSALLEKQAERGARNAD